jgi:hypothetical protein
MGFLKSLRHAWNVFLDKEDGSTPMPANGIVYGNRPDRMRYRQSNEQSIISSIYTRLGIDVATVELRHVRLDQDDRYIEDIDSGLNNCLTVEANIDQAARHFRQDIAMSLFDEGAIAIVPVDTTLNPNMTGGYDIQTMRVGRIKGWEPESVRVTLFNQKKGLYEEVTVAKAFTAIIENPLYAVMNEQNSTLRRLIRKLNLLDSIDEQSSSGKLDIIIQLPYVIKSEARKQQAEQRRSDIEQQLKGSKYGIAYTDGTEKITQLNRPSENNLLKQVEYLTQLLYTQLGLTEEVMNGTADEAAMLNYYNRTIEPVVAAIVEAMKRSFLTRTARSQKQTIIYFSDPFRLVPISQIADIFDKLGRNEVLTSNEMRQILKFKPVKDKKADQLINSNMPVADTKMNPELPPSGPPQLPARKPLAIEAGGNRQNGTGLPRVRNEG